MSMAASRTASLPGGAADATGLMSLAGTARPGFETVHSGHADLGHLTHDRDLTEKIMRKRQEEMQRRTKLLDPRKRQYGVDHAVLDSQLMEKRKAQESEVEEEMRHAEAQLMQDHVLHHLEGVKQAAMRDRQKAANDFSIDNLQKEKRREYYLSDPHALKKDRPVDVDDPNLGPSCFQKFEGQADADPSIRKRIQQQQQRDWLSQQIREKQEREQAERDMDNRFDQEAIAACQVRSYCEHAEREERRMDKLEEAAHNKELANIHSNRRQARAQREAEEKERHVAHVKNSMSQEQDWKLGSNGKLLKAEYKRITLDEEQEVYNTLAQQVLDKQMRRQAELAEEAEHSRATATGTAVLAALESERSRQQQAKTKRMVDHNKGLEAVKHRGDDDERRKYRSWEHEP
mmetsp:Transcript_39947/g.115119  ORF Transcript_39947/g.115119 Transcript_39947/m.115119 type:complete len:403 (-) Transcript_39947:100-1308(-)